MEASELPVSFCTKKRRVRLYGAYDGMGPCGRRGDRLQFYGTGGHAPLEEALLSLDVNGYAIPNIDSTRLKPLGALWQTLTGSMIPEKKPVIGEKILKWNPESISTVL